MSKSRFGNRHVDAYSDRALDAFTRAYIDAALWSSLDDSGQSLDKRYTQRDIARPTLAQMVKDCRSFQRAEAKDLAVCDSARAGHDFWLTRNRHGAGFWDRGIGAAGDRLTKAAHAYGSYDLYVGDNGKIWGSR